MRPTEQLRRWLPATLLAIGVGVGVYFKWPRPNPVQQTTPLELPREERCDEQGWCTQTLPGGAARETTFSAAWAAGADDVWAVGLTGVAVHWDGAQWSSMPTSTPILRGVYGFTTNDVWLVGRQRALHWDGVQLAPVYDFAPMKMDPEGIIRTTTWGPFERGGEVDWRALLPTFGAHEAEVREGLRSLSAKLGELPELLRALRLDAGDGADGRARRMHDDVNEIKLAADGSRIEVDVLDPVPRDDPPVADQPSVTHLQRVRGELERPSLPPPLE